MPLAADIFTGDAFGVIPLSQSLSKTPFVPSQAGTAVAWESSFYDTTSIAIEEMTKTVGFVAPTPRGAPGVTFAKEKRSMLKLSMPHFQIDDHVNADEVQGVREYGEEQATRDLLAFVNSRMADHWQLRMEPTIELMKLGALKGLITYSDSTTLDLFSTFGVSQPAEVDMNLDAASATGAVRATCAAIIRTMSAAMGGVPFGRVRALCSASFYDALIKNAEVRATYLQQQEASQLRDGYVYGSFNFGGILWEEYRGSGVCAIADDKANLFPLDSPGLYRVGYAPGDWNDTVNKPAQPRYARVKPDENDKGFKIEAQTNPLAYCTRPNALVQAKIT